MIKAQPLNAESPAVQAHLTIVQGVINRMAVSSRFCKVWCVTLISATLVLVARAGQPDYALIALVPAALLFLLDSYYLAQERAFRDSYSEFVTTLHEGNLNSYSLYNVAPSGSISRHFLACWLSFSVWSFYAMAFITIILVWWLIFLAEPSPMVTVN